MASIFYTIMHPSMYHGHRKNPPFFEGWYHKIVSADQNSRYAIIPGVILGENAHAFIQVLNGVSATVAYHTFPVGDFWASDKDYQIRIGGSTFLPTGFVLALDTPAGKVHGEIRVHDVKPWPVTLFSPGVMGWYAWMPSMECYHGVLSFDHPLTGSLEIDGKKVDFTGGRGYMEKDWGASFPEGYVWMQTNHFDQANICLTASVAVIPWLGTTFPGFFVGLWLAGRLYRFATYTGAKIERLNITEDRIQWVVYDKKFRLEINALQADAGLLKGPTRLDMGRRVSETLNAIVEIRLLKRGGELVFSGKGKYAGLEVFQSDRLPKFINQIHLEG